MAASRAVNGDSWDKAETRIFYEQLFINVEHGQADIPGVRGTGFYLLFSVSLSV